MTNLKPVDCVRLWKDGTTSAVLECRDGPEHSIILSIARCDALYSQWAASDYAGGFYDYAHAIETADRSRKHVPLTPEDKDIYARLWMHASVTPMTLIEGDHHDAEIMDLLQDAAAANEGHTTDRDLAYVEEASYVYWAEQTDPDFDFDPIIIS